MRLAASLFAVLAFCSMLSANAAETQALRGHVPAVVAVLKAVGELQSNKPMRLAIALPLRNRQALTNFLQQLYEPGSPGFRRYLTSQQFAERFGPTKEDYQGLMDFAKAQGLTVTGTYSNRALLDVSGTVASVERTFHVHLHVYQHPTESRTFYAPDTEPSVDTAIPILEVRGLNNYILPRPMLHRLAKPTNAKPNMGSGPGGTFMGNDFRNAYLPGVTLTGAGQKVGLFELDGYYTNDPAQYASMAGLTNVLSITNILIDGADGTPGGNNSEVALDIEMVMSMAPGAQILVYEGTYYAADVLNRMASDNLAAQLSSSWQYETGPAMDQAYQQMAAQGQSYFNSSGDLGAYSGPVTGPSDDPYITIVGGTELTTTTNGSWASEATWSWADSGIGTAASGGGISTQWAIPTWQQEVGMANNGGSTTMRNLPDVAMVADNVEIIADNGQQEADGGTSISTPLWAAFTALVNQQGASQGQQSVGFLNPVIYAIGQSTNYGTSFHDIVSGDNTNSASPTNFFAVPGYDLCTGWGSPTADLIQAVLSYQFVSPVGWTLTSLPSLNWATVASSADGTELVAGDSSGHYQIYVSTSSGVTWRTYGPIASWRGIGSSADGTKLAAASYFGHIYVSTNSGASWTATTAPSYTWRSMTSSADGTKLAAGSFIEGVFEVSADSGSTWNASSIPGGGYNWPPVAWSADGSVLLAACGNVVFISTNSGVTYKSNTLAEMPGMEFFSLAASSNGSKLYAAGGSIYVSTNLGSTWAPTGAQGGNWNLLACSADGNRVVTAQNAVYVSDDGGVTWTNVGPQQLPSGQGWTALACSADGSKIIAANDGGGIYVGFFPYAPILLSQPINQTVECGLNVSFSASASGTSPLSYQWYFGSTPLSDSAGISGSTTPTLTLNTVSLSEGGVYTLNVANSYGSTNSISVTLSVQITNQPVLNSLSVQPNGSVTGIVNGFAGLTYIETSTNLITWTMVTNIVLTNSSVQFIDASASNYPQRFYRARVE